MMPCAATTFIKLARPASSGSQTRERNLNNARITGLRLWDDYQSAALLIALPSVLYIRERNTLGVHMKLASGSMRHDFLQGLDQNVARWNPDSPENCQRCATQHGSSNQPSL